MGDRGLGAVDRRVFRWVAGLPEAPALDRGLRGLSRAADHGRLWGGCAGVLAAVGGHRARRAAARGLAAVTVASVTANTVAKWTVGRRRPALAGVPVGRRLGRQPATLSFPSGHSASAAAFVTGVALESTRYGALLAPVAAAVAFSRVWTGVHYPGDVLAGCALGAGAALVTCRYWPPRPQRAVPHRTPGDAPALPGGRGLGILVNTGAGGGGSVDAAVRLRALLPGADVVECGPGDDLGRLLDEAAGGAALGVCGGDGTVNAAAGVACARGLPLAVFPGGTLNHFAGDLGVQVFEDTAEAVVAGEAVRVDLAEAVAEGGEGPEEAFRFLNTFGIGLYPELVRRREALEGRIGKWPAAAVALARVLRGAVPMEVTIDGEPRRVWLLFAGNCDYAPAGFAPAYRPRLDDGLLDLRAVDARHRLARTRAVLAALTGTLGRSPVYESALAPEVRIGGLEGISHLAHDGEAASAPDALYVRKRPRALTVYCPAVPADEVVQRARAAAGIMRLRRRRTG
ncbi:phosphatase PAP2 family protein [Streptomyces sp. NPDC060194]|uniref:bifunctional phosphatase PAP2/diacylglycerol kinase family protein n=1 Tax=Streptomyces sp. NPDC060194 TaxID=3347069 RepID=UPI00364D2555